MPEREKEMLERKIKMTNFSKMNEKELYRYRSENPTMAVREREESARSSILSSGVGDTNGWAQRNLSHYFQSITSPSLREKHALSDRKRGS